MRTNAPSKKAGLLASMKRDGAFRLFLAGSSVSMLGSRVTTIAYPMLVLYLTGSPTTAGWVAFAATAPSLFVYMPAGALVDRWDDPKSIMLISEAGRGIAIGVVTVTLLCGRPSVTVLVIAAVAEEILEVFSTLAERRCVHSLVGRDQASSALARIEGRTHVVVLAGRPLGGFLFEVEHIFPFLFDTLSFAISVCTLVGIRGKKSSQLRIGTDSTISSAEVDRKDRGGNTATSPYRTADMHLKNDIRDGLRELRANPRAKLIIILAANATLISQALLMIFLAEAHEQRLSSVMVSMILAASGVGGILGSMLASRPKGMVKMPLIQIQLWVWSIAFALLWTSGGKSFIWMAFVMIILGFTGALSNIQFGAYLMDSVAETMLARVTSFGNLMSFAACAFGPAFGGMIFQDYRTKNAVLTLFVFTLVLAVISVVAPQMRSPKARSQDSPGSMAEGSRVPAR
jgi:MFS family permease